MKSYSWSFKLLHWLMAVLILLMFFALVGFQPDMSDADRTTMLIGHSSIGTIITALMVVRLSKRFVLKQPRPKHVLKPMQAKLAKATHYALYFLMVFVPVTGYITANFHHLPVQAFASFSLNGGADSEVFGLVRLIHTTSVKALLVLVLLHIGAALFHKFVLKDRVLYSMRPWFAGKKKNS